ncbi:MAG TPA: hypothetical protein VFJ02_10920 [Vicinamibacterales bacterium]|nr:hypothetical protein [Vicinamibacterales bacterium]
MDTPEAMGLAMSVARGVRLMTLAIGALVWAASAAAGDRYALIVAGASGGPEYAEQYARWTRDLSSVLSGRMKLPPDHIKVLADTPDPSSAATAGNVRRHLAALRRTMTGDDLLFIVLIGHGTYDGVDAKFNLVGTDLESAQWAELLAGLPGQVIVVNTSSASFPFIERLSGQRRIVIAATDSVAQRFDTVFPEYFVKAFQGDAADIDKNDRISIWEAFSAATIDVRKYYQRRGQLSTERALLDDNGDGVGREAAGNGEDGSLASRVYLDEPLPGAPPTDEVLVKLLQRRAAIEAELDDLKIRRSFLKPAEYQQEFERLMVELARVQRDVRARIKS